MVFKFGPDSSPLAALALTLFAGYNASLLLIIGALLIAADDSSGQIGSLLGGMVLIALGFLFSFAICGLRSSRDWGRKILFWCSAVSLPLYAAAMFPIFQNEKMTAGNTLLQCLCMVAALLVLKALARPKAKGAAGHRDSQSSQGPASNPEEASAFTFDRDGKADDLFP
jgi:hypothetical protein